MTCNHESIHVEAVKTGSNRVFEGFNHELIIDVLLFHGKPGLLEGRVNLRQVKAGSVVAHQGDQVSVWGQYTE